MDLRSLVRRSLSTSTLVRIKYLKRYGRLLSLGAPKTFNAHLARYRLITRDARIPDCIDKAAVKKFVANTLGSEWVTPTLFEGPELPPIAERTWPLPYVIKSTHGSNQRVFVRTEAERDWEKIDRLIKRWQSRENEQWPYNVWPYSVMRRWLLVEPFIGGRLDLPLDYKLFVFGGKVEYIQVDSDRETSHKRAFYSRQWDRLNFSYQYPSDPSDFERPASLDQMIEGAERLASGLEFVRIDLYEIAGSPRFGEMSFFPEGGFGKFEPASIDYEMGRHWPV